jgi:hypothetical protein
MPRSSGAGDALLPLERVVIITGNYGSGKTEVAVNWTLHLAQSGVGSVSLADLDVVNPYFRCREAAELLRGFGVQVIVPQGETFHSELPIILPEIKGLLQRDDGIAVLDVGGDDVGARVLRSFGGFFRAHEMLQVVNAFRPFTDTVAGCLRIQDEIQESSGLRMTGIIGNAHLMDETSLDTILRGAELAAEVAERRGLCLRFVTALRPFADEVARRSGLPVLPLDRWMLPPWKRPPRTVGPLFKGT